MFEVGDIVVYPAHGVGKIVSIEEKQMMGKTILYYIIQLEYKNMKLQIPVKKANELGLRKLSSKEELEECYDILKKGEGMNNLDWRDKYSTYKEKIKSGNLKDIAEVIISIYKRSKKKDLSVMERKLFDSAWELFIDEASFISGTSYDEAEKFVKGILEGN